jgi:hypothetical protein
MWTLEWEEVVIVMGVGEPERQREVMEKWLEGRGRSR